MKSIFKIAVFGVLALAASHSVSATPPPPLDMPDAGSSALLLGLASAALVLGRRHLGRK